MERKTEAVRCEEGGVKNRRCLVCGEKIELDKLTNFVVSKLYFGVGYCRRNNENWTTG